MSSTSAPVSVIMGCALPTIGNCPMSLTYKFFRGYAKSNRQGHSFNINSVNSAYICRTHRPALDNSLRHRSSLRMREPVSPIKPLHEKPIASFFLVYMVYVFGAVHRRPCHFSHCYRHPDGRVSSQIWIFYRYKATGAARRQEALCRCCLMTMR